MEKEIKQLKLHWILNKLFLHILFFIGFTNILFSQEDGNKLYDHRLNENKWSDLREGIRYEGHQDDVGRQWTYESKEEYEKAKRNSKQGKNGSGEGSGSGEGGSGNSKGGSYNERSNNSSYPKTTPRNISAPFTGGLGIFGYILLGVFVVALAFLIYYLFINQPKDGKKVGALIEIEDMNPSEIPLTELQRLLQEALNRGDYRGAIRIYFIFIIRDLSTKGWIRWEKEKTNLHYLREMSGKSEFDDFNQSVSFFEIIWYGKRELDVQKFEQIRPKFTRLLDKLGVK